MEYKDILIGECVFIGSYSVIKGEAHVGHHSAVVAETVVGAGVILAHSPAMGKPMHTKPSYY